MEKNAHLVLAVPVISKLRKRKPLKTASPVKHANKGTTMLYWLSNRRRQLKEVEGSRASGTCVWLHERIAVSKLKSELWIRCATWLGWCSCTSVLRVRRTQAGHPDDRIGTSEIEKMQRKEAVIAQVRGLKSANFPDYWKNNSCCLEMVIDRWVYGL